MVSDMTERPAGETTGAEDRTRNNRPASRGWWFATLAAVFLAYLTADLYVAKSRTDYFLRQDGREYLAGAYSFLENGTLMTGEERYYEAPRTRDIPEAYRPPLMAFATGVLAKLLRDPLVAAAAFMALSATLLVWAVFLAGRKLGGPLAGAISAALAICHPLFLPFSLCFSSECPFSMLLAVFILAWVALPAPWKYPAMGALAALACGVRPTVLLLLPAFGVFQLLRCAASRFFRDAPSPSAGGALREYALYAAAFLLVLSPMCIRNRVNYGTWNPAGSLGGFNLFVGNNRDNALAYRASTGREFLEHQNAGWNRAIEFAKAMPSDLSPVEQDRRFREAAMEEIRAQGPGEIARMSVMKAWHFLRPWPMRGAHSEAVFWCVCMAEALLYAFGIAGVVLMRDKRTLLLLLLMILSVGLSAHSLVHVQLRHRIPFLDVPLILLAGVSLARVIRAGCGKVKSRLGHGAESTTP